MNLFRAAFLPLALLAGSVCAQPAPAPVPRPDWERFFSEANATGTIVVADERSDEQWVWNAERAATRFCPASTFKVPHALFALDAGVLRDEFEKIPWDGIERSIAGWNADQTLRSSMRHSTVWVYQGFARAIGAGRERAYLAKAGYGSLRVGDDVETFWLDGSLAISAVEQVAFLRRLHRNELPFGWWVGWVETPQGAVFFALNIDVPGGMADAGKREAIGRAVLAQLGALPGS